MSSDGGRWPRMTGQVHSGRDVARPAEILALLRLLARHDEASHAGLARRLQREGEELGEALEQAGLTQAFLAHVEGTPLYEALPVATREAMWQFGQRQRERNADYLALLVEYFSRLERARVEPVLLKGLYLAQRFYGHIDHRFMWDADVLVCPSQWQVAIRAAGDLGLQLRGRYAPLGLLRLASLHAVEVKRSGQAIDIHWCLRARAGYRIDYGALRARATRMPVGGRVFPVLSDEDALLLALLELASDMERSRIKLRSLWDLYLILRELEGTLDWEGFLALRGGEGLLPLTANMLCFGVLILDGRDEFPRLVRALAGSAPEALIDNVETAHGILARPPGNLANRALYARLQPASAVGYWLRRALTSPLRRALIKR